MLSECFIKIVLTRTYQLVLLRPGSQNCGTKRQKSTRIVRRHNTETGEMKLMVRKYQKFQIFLKETLTRLPRSQPQTIAITANCSRRLVQEKFQTNMHRLTTRAHATISVKQQEQKAQ